MKSLHGPVYESRMRVLVREILPHLTAHDRVLDVGCGFGTLGRRLLDAPGRPEGLSVRGLERFPRGGELIPVDAYAGGRMPYDEQAFDVVTIADVLHHEEDPAALLAECARIARRIVIVKDHQRRGFLAQSRISFIDWAANAPYGVKCLYRYPTNAGWHALFAEVGLAIETEQRAMNLYPPLLNLVFGRSLQYFAVLRPARSDGVTSSA